VAVILPLRMLQRSCAELSLLLKVCQELFIYRRQGETLELQHSITDTGAHFNGLELNEDGSIVAIADGLWTHGINGDSHVGKVNVYESPQNGLNSVDLTNDVNQSLSTLLGMQNAAANLRADLGVQNNSLQFRLSNFLGTALATKQALSRIEDADFATETAVLAKTQVLQQTGAAVLAQANARPQLVLQLIK